MIPYINLRAAQELLDLLSIWDSDNKSFYEQNFLNYSFKVNFLAEVWRADLPKRSDQS